MTLTKTSRSVKTLAALLAATLAASPLFAADVSVVPELAPQAQAPLIPNPGALSAPGLVPGLQTPAGISLPASAENLSLPVSASVQAAAAAAAAAIAQPEASASVAAPAAAAVSAQPAQAQVSNMAEPMAPGEAEPLPPRAAEPVPPAQASAPLIQRLSQKISAVGYALFDGFASRPSAYAFGILRPERHPDLKLPKGVKVTRKQKPMAAQGGPISISRFYLSPDHVLDDGSKPITLSADPTDMNAVEQALRGVIDANPSEYGATSSQDMATVHVQRFAGIGNQADSIIAVFRQVKQSQDLNGKPYFLAVEGANLRFHLKVLNGKPVVMAVEGGFAPGIDPSVMTVGYSDDQLASMAEQQLQDNSTSGAQAPQLSLLTRQITFIDNAWRAANVYQGNDLNGNPVIVIVDVHSGKAYVVNADDIRYRSFPGRQSLQKPHEAPHAPRAGLISAALQSRLEAAPADSDASSVSGSAAARGTTLTADGQDHGRTGPMPLINTYVYNASGRILATTDAQGRFTIPATENNGQPMQVTVKLSGVYGQLFDEDSNDSPLAATMMVTPGQPVTLTVNSTGDDEQLDANVNGYVYPYQMIEWLKSMLGLGNDPRFFKPLLNGIHANGTQMVANAFYDPVTDAFYLMKRGTLNIPASNQASGGSVSLTKVPRTGGKGRARTITLTAENTAQPSIELHEFGHRQFQVASQLRLTDTQAADPAYRFVKWLLDPILGSDSNEAGADTFSMFIRNSPIIGNGFFLSASPASKLPNPDIIRTGENQTQFDNSGNTQDDPHQQGETQMGTAWKTRQDLIQEMGPTQGALYAALLFIRTWLYIQPGNVPSALTHALLADMAQDGTIPHGDIIRGHASEHGLTLPTAPVPAGNS